MHVLPDIQSLSNGYWLVEGFEVTPDGRLEVPVLQNHLYGYIQDEYYGSVGIPITFRHNQSEEFFAVVPDGSARIGEIRMPISMVSSMGIDPSPETTDLLLVKPEHAKAIRTIDTDRDTEAL